MADADGDGDRHQMQNAVRLGNQAQALLTVDGLVNRRLTGDDDRRSRRRPDGREHLSGLVRHQQQVRVQLILVVTGVVLDGGRIVGVDRGLERGRVRDETGHHRKRLCAGRA